MSATLILYSLPLNNVFFAEIKRQDKTNSSAKTIPPPNSTPFQIKSLNELITERCEFTSSWVQPWFRRRHQCRWVRRSMGRRKQKRTRVSGGETNNGTTTEGCVCDESDGHKTPWSKAKATGTTTTTRFPKPKPDRRSQQTTGYYYFPHRRRTTSTINTQTPTS